MLRISATSASCRNLGVAFTSATLPPDGVRLRTFDTPCLWTKTAKGRPADDPDRAAGPRPPRPAPAAADRPGWRNPRLLLGLVLVAGSVVLGARLLAAADDTVGVWAVARDLPAGAALDDGRPGAASGPLPRRRRPRTATSSATDDVPKGATLNRPVSAGELLPRSAFAAGSERRPGRGADQRRLRRPACHRAPGLGGRHVGRTQGVRGRAAPRSRRCRC